MTLDDLPLGRYTATINKVEMGQSMNKGTPYVRILVSLNDHPDTGGAVDIWLTAKAMGMARGRLKKCGYDPDAGSLRDLTQNPSQLRGNEVEVELVEEVWQGNIRRKLEFPSAKSKPPSDDVLDALDKGLREVKGSTQGPPQTQQEAPPPAQGGDWDGYDKIDQDDIPF